MIMKTIILFTVMAFVAAEEKYYHLVKIDMHKLSKNIEKLQEFTNCLLEKCPCNDLYESYRVVCAEAVRQICKKCTPYQKNAFWLFLQALISEMPSEYCNFRQKYDPEDKYFEDLETEINKFSDKCFEYINYSH